MGAAIEIALEKSKFPAKLTKEEGEILEEEFVFEKKMVYENSISKTIHYRYIQEINGEIYVLVVEFMFRDSDMDLDVNRSIGKNYYLTKKNTP